MHSDNSPARQAERRSAVYAKHREFCRGYFDDEGRFRFERPVPDTRSGLFHAFSFLHGDEADVRLANRLIAQAPIDREAFKSLHTFYPMLAAELLNHHGERLEPGQHERLTEVLKQAVTSRLQERKPGGYNDNHPLLQAGGILAGAAVVPTDTAVLDTATGALEQTLRLLDRRGFLSEYTSPTYSPVSMLCFAEIAEFCPSERARELARESERRLWLEIASHWHPATCSLAGPHSRAYQIDLLAHFHNAHVLMYLVFGADAVPIHPLNHLFPYYDDRQFGSRVRITGRCLPLPRLVPGGSIRGDEDRSVPAPGGYIRSVGAPTHGRRPWGRRDGDRSVPAPGGCIRSVGAPTHGRRPWGRRDGDRSVPAPRGCDPRGRKRPFLPA